ncbi:unnamed protein product [Parajaminaea phylloscopi]
MDTVVAGAMAALAVDALIYPLDTVKTRLQTPDVAKRFPTRKALFQGLYQGIGATVIVTLPSAGVFFTTYEGAKSALSPSLSGSALHMVSSSLAELASCAVLTPAEIIKQRAQVATSSSSSSSSQQSAKSLGSELRQSGRQALSGEASVASAARQSAQTVSSKIVNDTAAGQTAKATMSSAAQARGGPNASLAQTFVRGYFALAGRNLPFTAVQFPLYEHFRVKLSERWHVGSFSDMHSGDVVIDGTSNGDRAAPKSSGQSTKARRTAHEVIVKPGLVAACSAATAGSISALLSTPIDNAKTRIMVNSPTSPDPSVQGGTLRTMSAIYRNDGWTALWRGGLLRSAWTALGAAIYLGSYESGRLWWRTRGQLTG